MTEPTFGMTDAPGFSTPSWDVDEALNADPRLRKVREFLESDVSRHLTLSRAAAIAKLTRAYFSDYFRRKTGICFTQWVHAVRIRRAVVLLATTGLLIGSISSAVGYRDLRTFERAFRSRMRMSAREYRTRYFGSKNAVRHGSACRPSIHDHRD